MKNNSFEEIWDALKNSKKVIIPLHPRPDGDSLGSCIALAHGLKQKGIEYEIISKDEITDNLKKFDFDKEVNFKKNIEEIKLDEFDFIILLDHGFPEYYSEEFHKKTRNKIINIDHHFTNEHYGVLNYVDGNSPSCASIIFEFLKEGNFKFENIICRSLLLGICTDTGFFEFGNSADSFEKAAYLVSKGKINFQHEFVIPILKSTPWKIKKLHGILLANMKKEFIDEKNVIFSCAEKKEYKNQGLNTSDIRSGIFCMQDIADSDVIFNIIEMETELKGSFRSEKYDTTIYSREFGGGGHKGASAFIMSKKPMKEAIKDVLDVIKLKGFLSQSKL